MKSGRVAGWAAAVVLAVSAGAMSAQSRDWKIDAAHSDAGFAIKHMSISTVHGSFRGVSGIVKFDPVDVAKSGVEATIDVNSVDTGVAARDNDLKSPNFFDTAKFPTMTFKSTRVSKVGDHYDVSGDLTLHGVTRQVSQSCLRHLPEPSLQLVESRRVNPEQGGVGKTLFVGCPEAA